MSMALPDTLNVGWKDNKSRFGYKMLQKMGWSEEKGLGKKEEGIVAAVKLKRREDGLGLGMEKLTDGAGAKGWAETATSFSSVLDVLKQAYKKPDKKKRRRAESGNADEGEGNKERRKARKERREGREGKDKAPPIRISVGMKYKKHSQAKSMSNKSDEDLRSVLGAAASPRPAVSSSNSSSSSGPPSGRLRSGSQASLGDSAVGLPATRQRSGSTVSVQSVGSVGSGEAKKKRKKVKKEKRERSKIDVD